jgi:hypothetical protein
MRAEAERLNNEKRLGAAVVRAIDNSARRQTERDTVLVAGRGG